MNKILSSLLILFLLQSATVKASPWVEKVLNNAYHQTEVTHSYDPSYVKIDYPNGDVPENTGICVDVIIRAMRAVNIDLQRLIHIDMSQHFSAYPKIWGLKKPDANIDHRRVPNLMTYLRRHEAQVLPMDREFEPADIVAWRLPGGRLHVGLISDQQNDHGAPLVVHNIGEGAKVEDVLYQWTIIGHYRLKS